MITSFIMNITNLLPVYPEHAHNNYDSSRGPPYL